MIFHGATVNVHNFNANTPLHKAIGGKSEFDHGMFQNWNSSYNLRVIEALECALRKVANNLIHPSRLPLTL